MDRKPQAKLFLPLVALCCFFNKVIVLCFIHAAAAAAAAAAATPSATDVHVPAVYVFGDSLADVGNNNYLPGNTAVANFRPWGVDYPGGVPTGRFSNGYIFADFLAMKMGFSESPPPSLAVINASSDDKRPLPADFRGLNFASGGSGILDSTGSNISYSLSTQVNWFAEVVARLMARKGKPAADADLSRSPVIFSAGANDLAIYLGPLIASSTNSSSNASSLPPPHVFVSSLLATYRAQLRRIYSLGARKFVFIDVAKLGCVPGARALTANGGCLDQFNVIVQMFNKAVQDMLRRGLADPDDDHRFYAEGFQYSVTNAYELSSRIIAHPLSFGMTDVKRACCGLGTFDNGGLCKPNTTNLCADRDQHLFWDVSHPSEAAAKLIADYGFSGPPEFAYPINIAQLLHLNY